MTDEVDVDEKLEQLREESTSGSGKDRIRRTADDPKMALTYKVTDEDLDVQEEEDRLTISFTTEQNRPVTVEFKDGAREEVEKLLNRR